MFTHRTKSRGVLRDLWSYTSIITEWGPILIALFSEDNRPVKKIPKKVFFIRHPHTGDEEDKIYRGDHAEITQKGWEQAEMVANRIADIGGITHIVTSTLLRSRDLTSVIANRCNALALPESVVKVIQSDLFVECRKPSELVDLPRGAPHPTRVMRRIRRLFDRHYRYSDEENRWRLEFRVFRAFRMLAALDAECVVVVTHGKFLRALWHYQYEHSLRGFYIKADRLMRHDHTGITVFSLEPAHRSGSLQWNLVSWNDVAHTEAFVPSQVLRALAARA